MGAKAMGRKKRGERGERSERRQRGRGMTAHYSGDKLERKREENVRVDRNKNNGMSFEQEDTEEELK